MQSQNYHEISRGKRKLARTLKKTEKMQNQNKRTRWNKSDKEKEAN